MFEVENNITKEKCLVYAAETRKDKCGCFVTQFLIYNENNSSLNKWQWVNAYEYKLIQPNGNSVGLDENIESDIDDESHFTCEWCYDYKCKFATSKCGYSFDAHRNDPYEFKYCPNCGKEIDIREE